MDLIHEVLNVAVPLLTFTGLLFFLPLCLICKFISFMRLSKSIETMAGKVVLITGASSGIGENLAYEYAKRAAHPALADKRKDRLPAVANKARRLGSPDAIVLPADVSILEHCNRLVNETVKHFGQLDHLVNNAGILQAGSFEDCTQGQYSKFGEIMVHSNLMPSKSEKDAERQLWDSACRGDMYLTEPSWVKFGFWLRVFCPELLEKLFQLTTQQGIQLKMIN